MIKEIRREKDKKKKYRIQVSQHRKKLKKYYRKYIGKKLVAELNEQDFLFDKDASATYFVAYDTKEFAKYNKTAHRGRPVKRED